MKQKNLKLIAVFALCNAALALFAWSVLLRPIADNLENMQRITHMQQSRLDIYIRRAAAYAAGEFSQADAVLNEIITPYYALADTLGELSRMAESFGLRELVFVSSQPIQYERGGHSFYDVRVSAVYEGTPHAAVAFLQSAEANLREMHMEFACPDRVQLRINFSLPLME